MLTDQDIQKITKAQEEVFPSREDFEIFKEELKNSFSNLQGSVDSYSKKADTYYQEMAVLNQRVKRLEEWIQQVAQKVGIELQV